MPIADTITGIITKEIVITYFVLLLFMIVVFILNKYQKYYMAICFWLGTVLFTVFMFSVYLLPQAYSEYYYVFLSGVALTLFNKNTIPIIITLLSLFLFYTPYYIIVVYPQYVVDKLDPFAIVGLFSCVYLLVNYFKKTNNENEKKLNEVYEELEKTKKNELASLQLKFLKSRMNPHFMFNAMNSVQNLAIKGKVTETYKFLSKFSAIIRENLNTPQQQYIEFHKEFSLLKKYLELEELRFDEIGDYILEIGNTANSILIPPMIVQSFVENSIYRMFHNINDVNRITIKFYQTDFLQCVITDNGISFEEEQKLSQENTLEKTSFIIENMSGIKEHLKLLNDLYEIKIEFDYVSLKDSTTCTIKIPYKKNSI